jgi:hypothetical protein
MKRYIQGMAFSRADVIEKIQHNIEKSIDHFIRLIAFPSSWDVNHWKTEIYGHLHDMYKMGSSKRFPDKKLIYDYTYGKRQDLITDPTYFKKRLKQNEITEKLKCEIDITEAMNEVDRVCTGYYDWLASKLSTTGYVTSDEVYAELNQLLK